MKTGNTNILIDELIGDPMSFFESGKSNILLQEYFKGLPIETLIPLLQSTESYVQKVSIWIVSELASNACSLLPYVIPLLESNELYIRYYALESVVICARGRNINEFIHLIRAIDDVDADIRVPAMILLSNAEEPQLTSAIELVELANIPNYKVHQKGLTDLVRAKEFDISEIKKMLEDNDPLIQRYGAIIGKKLDRNNTQSMQYALFSNNLDVRKFAELVSETI